MSSSLVRLILFMFVFFNRAYSELGDKNLLVMFGGTALHAGNCNANKEEACSP